MKHEYIENYPEDTELLDVVRDYPKNKIDILK